MRSTIFLLTVLSSSPFSGVLARQAGNDSAARILPNTNQLNLDGGSLLAFSLAYTHRLGSTPWGVGGGIGFAWELNSKSFERNIWNATHAEVLFRFQPVPQVQFDAGPTWMSYDWADDCSDCSGKFFGGHFAFMFGYRYFFFGVNVRVGRANDDRFGSAFGNIVSPQLRVAIPWG